MKKGVLVLLVCCLLTVATPAACAEGLDLSGYDDDGLLALLSQVQSEIVARHIEKTAQLPAGTYIGGRDIPAGAYVLTGNGGEKDSGIVWLRGVNDEPNQSKLYHYTKASDGYTVYLTIEDDDTLILPYAFTLTVSGGVMFR